MHRRTHAHARAHAHTRVHAYTCTHARARAHTHDPSIHPSILHTRMHACIGAAARGGGKVPGFMGTAAAMAAAEGATSV